MATYDPYQILPFYGYIDDKTGERELHYSLAHFYHHERLSGSHEGVRRHLASIEDADLFRIEVEGVGYETTAENWAEGQVACLKAGLYMQAVEHPGIFGSLIEDSADLNVANCSFSSPLADALSNFIVGLGEDQDALKVAFLGEAPKSFANDCFKVIFGNRLPDTLFALQSEPLAEVVSNLARKIYAPLALISSELDRTAAAENMSRRCTHYFIFDSAETGTRAKGLAELLAKTGKTVTPISVGQTQAS